MKIKRLLLSLIIVLATNTSLAIDLPDAPENFQWVEAEEINGAFLKPNGWYFKKHKKGKTQAYFITKENIDKKGYFITGVSINVIPNIPEIKNISATKFALQYIIYASSNRQIIKKPWSHSMGPFNSFGVVTLNEDKKLGDFNTHNLAISNDKTGTVYIVTYEAPTDTWKQSWETGKVILGKLFINSET